MAVVTILYQDAEISRMMKWHGPAATVEMQPVFAPSLKLRHSFGEATLGNIEHVDAAQSEMSQCAYTLLNLLQSGTFYVSLPDWCDRLIVMLDLTSLVLNTAVALSRSPIAHYRESIDDKFRLHPIPCRKSHVDVYVVDTAISDETPGA